jgi:hypothetical protein
MRALERLPEQVSTAESSSHSRLADTPHRADAHRTRENGLHPPGRESAPQASPVGATTDDDAMLDCIAPPGDITCTVVS